MQEVVVGMEEEEAVEMAMMELLLLAIAAVVEFTLWHVGVRSLSQSSISISISISGIGDSYMRFHLCLHMR
jgi:hypothetical protein